MNKVYDTAGLINAMGTNLWKRNLSVVQLVIGVRRAKGVRVGMDNNLFGLYGFQNGYYITEPKYNISNNIT